MILQFVKITDVTHGHVVFYRQQHTFRRLTRLTPIVEIAAHHSFIKCYFNRSATLNTDRSLLNAHDAFTAFCGLSRSLSRSRALSLSLSGL